MDNTLLSAFRRESAEKAARLTRNDDRVRVDVEDNIDEEFWEDLLKDICPQKEFHFATYHTYLKEDGDKVFARGKSHVLHPDEDFSKWHIGCVDSDYDWILSDYTGDGQMISSNKHLLQTYAYSIENLMCDASTLGDFCCENTEEDVTFDFMDYMKRLSKAVYPLLVWSAYLYSKCDMSFTPTAWREILVSTLQDEASLAVIEDRAKKKVEELNKTHVEDIEAKEKFQQTLATEKNITENDAYLFVRGHDLFDHLLYSVISPVVTKLRNRHFQTLRNTDTDEQSRKAALKEYGEKNKSVKDLLERNYRYKAASPIYEKIKNDVLQIW